MVPACATASVSPRALLHSSAPEGGLLHLRQDRPWDLAKGGVARAAAPLAVATRGAGPLASADARGGTTFVRRTPPTNSVTGRAAPNCLRGTPITA
eukprot:5748424-Prymnesium_polylepis.1